MNYSIARGLFLALSTMVLPAHANDAGGTTTYTDAIIPMVVIAAGEFPPAVKLDDKGFTWNGMVLATQQVRPSEAIVIDDTINKLNVKRPLLATLLGDGSKIWCKDFVNPNITIDCYRDSDGDGKLDEHARGYLPRLEALSLNRIGPFEKIGAIAFRKAEPGDLPTFNIDYLLCRADGSQIKFARRIKKVGFLATTVSSQCENVANPATNQGDAESVFMFDLVKIKVSTVDGARTATMSEGMPPGTLVGHLRTDRPITDIAHARRFSEEHEESLAELPGVYISSPPTIAKEPVKIGEKFFSAEVKHSLTGTLRSAAIQLKIFKGNPNELIPAGARMFGIKMRSTTLSDNLDADVIWCYPPPLNAPANRAKCIAYDVYKIPRVVDAWGRFALSNLNFASTAPAIEPPLIDRDTIDFGEPIVLEIVVEEVSKKWIGIRASLDRQSEQNRFADRSRIERDAKGNGFVMVGEGVLVLEPLDKDTIRISERLPVAVGESVEVLDLIAYQRSLRRSR